MRVLFTSTPGWGHIHPMVPLAQAFEARGDEVAWAVPEEATSSLKQAGFEAFAAGLGAAEAFAEMQKVHPDMSTIRRAGWEFVSFEAIEATRTKTFPKMFGGARPRRMLSDLLPVVDGWRPDLLIHDQGEFAGPIAAALAGIPNVCHAFGEGIAAAAVDAEKLGVVELWESVGLTPAPFAGAYTYAHLDIYPASLRAADLSHVPFVQPVRPVAFATGDPAPLPSWLGSDSTSLVYVTFGTVFNDNPDVIRAVVQGVRSLPVRVLVTVGPRADPAMLGDQPENVHVAKYVPQTQLLPHCAVVVSHAGSGTFLASLSEGLPQVCVPQGADQFANAAACIRGGVGRTLLPHEMTVESVRAATEEALSDKKYRLAAEKVQTEIAAMPDPAGVADVLATKLVAF